MLEHRKNEGYFPIPLWLHRNDIKGLGFDVDQLTDGDMEYLTQRIAQDHLGRYYPGSIRQTLESYMKHGRKPDDEAV
ncbi:hypothetical protein H6G00_15165 [Leptolyngbya sp. FACHB-541]|uniref:hypothetical protein n=1 Tax=Leptolyngbya sp. FACHB-541 TaxID=2692810 RepID=UPI001686093E|nr:hypothetical protein [Leptolyngbya sp. FACHB-541]MBD1997950.1 hypothetical protein [Leptolyngbya sp. FACHB-541]